MSTIRLWTFQRLPVSRQLLQDDKYSAAWERTPQNWRGAYSWMAMRLQHKIGTSLSGAPIWCWHSCNGRRGAPPTFWTARSLLSDFELQHGIEIVTLQVPDEFILLSSYWAWNQLLDFFIVNRALPRKRRLRLKMFETPLMKHRTDGIQAVLPFICREWVESVERVKSTCEDRDTPLWSSR